MANLSDETHARLCEEPDEGCGRCARIHAEREAARTIEEEREEPRIREALGWPAEVG